MDHQKWWFQPVELEPMPLGMNCKPWYKDRLPSKCFAKSKDRLKFPTSLNSRNWVFVKEGIDDFRKSCPPCTEMITRGPKGNFHPLIYRKTPGPAPKSCWKKLSPNSTLFSKLSQAQLARKAFVEEMEARVKPHPLASCPNLEDEMSPKLLREVLEVLDPDKQLKDTWAYLEDGKKRVKKHTGASKTPSISARLNFPKLKPWPSPDDWLKEMTIVEDFCKPLDVPKNVVNTVSHFCEWVASLGIEGIEKQSIIKQFEPIIVRTPKVGPSKIKDMILLSPKLLRTEGLTRLKAGLPVPDHILAKKEYDLQFSDERRMKMRYGAWYLHPKLWKKLREDEPLPDPNSLPDIEARSRLPPLMLRCPSKGSSIRVPLPLPRDCPSGSQFPI
ncbi:PREDICTED: protein FAM47A-like [Elephantulus edwardii]|uniref:protein FAM47A-like n=1 Tax=Elephantulus edwardii TaxID=28737 RepID=UPI0003F0EDD3|nr:PREDICTED: protein FAM47A-like [Elephantulus edwardii]